MIAIREHPAAFSWWRSRRTIHSPGCHRLTAAERHKPGGCCTAAVMGALAAVPLAAHMTGGGGGSVSDAEGRREAGRPGW